MKPPIFGLWPPIADALHVYRRRTLADPEAHYEHIWRLLQLNEAIIVCLGSVLATRLKSLWENNKEFNALLNDIRFRITGISYSLDKSNAIQGCLNQGSIMSWIDFFNYFRNIVKSNFSCRFCQSMYDYLSTTLHSPLSFLDAWKVITSVPLFHKETLNYLDRFEAINKLRNKIAHLPLPTAILPGLHRGLRREVLSSICPSYRNKEDDHLRDFSETDFAVSFFGRIIWDNVYVTGSDNIGEIPSDDTILRHIQRSEIVQVWAQPKMPDDFDPIAWPVAPFFIINNELKTLLLFKIDDLREEYPDGEYHRFAAELEPLQRYQIDKEAIDPWRSIGQDIVESTSDVNENDDTSTEAGGDETFLEENLNDTIISLSKKNSEELRNIAERAFCEREYPMAVQAFNELEKKHDTRYYNDVAKSKHGAAIWRSVEQSVNLEQKRKGLDKAIKLLTSAQQHRDPEYKARALYEKSKALWHRWLIKEDLSDLKDIRESQESAQFSTQYSYGQAYINWLQKITEELESRTKSLE